jgi:hypothetical protein
MSNSLPPIKSFTKNNKIILLACFIWLAFFNFYLLTVPSELPEGDEAIILGVADRVSRYGFSWLPPNANHNNRFSSYGFFDSGFSKYGLGQSLLSIPLTEFFLEAKETENWEVFTNAMLRLFSLSAAIGASTNAFFFLVCIKLGRRIDTSVLLTFILGLATMIWPYSQTLFSDPILATCWLLAIFSFLSYRDTKKGFWLGIAGIGIGFAILDKIVAAYTAPIFGAYFLYLLKYYSNDTGNKNAIFSRTSIIPSIWFAVPLAVALYSILYYNYIRYGNWFSLGYTDSRTYDLRDTYFGFNVPFLSGLYAQLFSSGKGFFFYNPACLLAFPGLRKSFKINKPETLMLISMILGSLAIYSSWYGWHGDWCWGLRYWSCMPPFFLLLAGPFVDQLVINIRTRILDYWKSTVFLSAIIILSIFVQIMGVLIKSNHYILMASQVEVFQGKFFNAKWPIRDDSLQLHFFPEFSPIAGHLWMSKIVFYRDSPEYSKIFSNPPWASMNHLWRLKSIDPKNFRYNVWWMQIWVNNPENSNAILAKAGFLFILFLSFSILGIRQALQIQNSQTQTLNN